MIEQILQRAQLETVRTKFYESMQNVSSNDFESMLDF